MCVYTYLRICIYAWTSREFTYGLSEMSLVSYKNILRPGKRAGLLDMSPCASTNALYTRFTLSGAPRSCLKRSSTCPDVQRIADGKEPTERDASQVRMMRTLRFAKMQPHGTAPMLRKVRPPTVFVTDLRNQSSAALHGT